MRLLAGQFRGRRLVVPEGARPTLGRVRQVLFDLLVHGGMKPDWHEGVVADVFAGSGSLGLEALSRGAEGVVFFESAEAGVRALEENIARLGVGGCCRILRNADALPRAGTACSVLLFDPPYDQADRLDAVQAGFRRAGWIAPDSLLVLQTPNDTPALTGLSLLRERRIGITMLRFYRGGDGVSE